MTRRLIGLAAVLGGLVAPAPATAANFYVHGTQDVPGSCVVIAGSPDSFRCDALRTAVVAATANPGADVILLQVEGRYVVTSELVLRGTVTILGRGPRTTEVRGSGAARVFAVEPGARATISRLTISGGRAPGDVGGNILNGGDLSLVNLRVTDGAALRGGGIANVGTLSILNSLIDNNRALASAQIGGAGGGIISLQGDGQPVTLTVSNTTVAFNQALGGVEVSGTGGGIAVNGTAQSTTTFNGITVARNSAAGSGVGGIIVAGRGHTAQIRGSIVNDNTGGRANCSASGLDESQDGSNIESSNTCPFEFADHDPQLEEILVNAGGDTDVLRIPATSIAKNHVTPCMEPVDQRSARRDLTSGCDAGAFEQGAVAPAINSGAFPEPQPVPDPIPITQPPPPTPTPDTAQPTPVANKTVVVRVLKGRVRFRPRGSRDFIELDGAQGIPTGSTVDTRKGVVELTSVPRAGAAPQTAKFYDGLFVVTQSRGITDLRLSELMLPCNSRARAAQRRPKKRKLWGDGRGAFRTSGRYSAATVRGTKWLVQDSCAGTLTRVRQGSVNVRDKVKRRTILVRAGRRYLARPPR
jgi:hypothetical protein